MHVDVWQNQYNIVKLKKKKKKNLPAMQDTGSLGLVHWDDPEGWYGMRREVGGEFRMGNTCTPVVDAC